LTISSEIESIQNYSHSP